MTGLPLTEPREFANRVVDLCDSTNDLARKLGEAGFAHGTWVSAREQSRGRGRLGREWKGLEGNLFLSIVVRMPEMRDWTWIPLAAAVGISDALERILPGKVRIKWPNDLWIKGAKLGGILCEATGGTRGSFVVIGIGLNCAVAPGGLDQSTVSLTQTAGRSIVADDLRLAVVDAVVARVDRLRDLRDTAIAELRRDFEERAALPEGTPIEWTPGSLTAASGTVASRLGTVIGLGESGELRVRENGAEIRLYAEDVKVRPLR